MGHATPAVLPVLLLIASPSIHAARDYYSESLQRLNGQLAASMGAVEAGRVEIPFELDADLIARARQITRTHVGLRQRAQRLVDFMLNKSELGLQYDPVASRTAMQVYQRRTGNCLAMTNLFIGLARAASISAYYVHVAEVRRFSEARAAADADAVMSDDLSGVVVHSSHICAGFSETGSATLVDFVPGRGKQYRSYEILDDLAAVAHLYNNKGFETAYHTRGMPPVTRHEKEIEYYETAIRIKPDFPAAYNNLGTSYKRRGDLRGALQLYAKAIQIDERFAEAYSNRASVYLSLGKPNEAVVELRRAIELDASNPYAYHDLGTVYFSTARYSEAEDCYKKAISRGRDPSFYVSLAKVQIALGRQKDAIDALRKGLKLAPGDAAIIGLLRLLGVNP